MTFTPIFIPMSGGGGGGGPIWPVMVFNAVLIGGIVKLWDYSFNPNFHLELKPSHYSATLCLKKRNHPHIQKVRYLNTECLKQKGYEFGSWNEYGSILISKKGEFNVKQLIADCKECNTYVEVDYDYTTVFSGKTKDATKRLSWASCNVRRELQ